jgi:hypothetical protein
VTESSSPVLRGALAGAIVGTPLFGICACVVHDAEMGRSTGSIIVLPLLMLLIGGPFFAIGALTA